MWGPMAGPRRNAVVTLSGESASYTDASVAYAAIHANSDGTMDKTENVTTSQIDAATDWIIPNAAASSSYEIRRTGSTGDSASLTGPAEDTWVDLSTNRTWSHTRSTSGTYSTTFTLEIRLGTTTLSSASYTVTAQVI